MEVLLRKVRMNPFKRPSQKNLNLFLEASKMLNFSYSEIGASRGNFPKGYDHDRNEIELGVGDEVWKAAKTAIEDWEMFPGNWANIFPSKTPIQKDETVSMYV